MFCGFSWNKRKTWVFCGSCRNVRDRSCRPACSPCSASYPHPPPPLRLCSQVLPAPQRRLALKKSVKIGRPGYRVTKQFDAETGSRSLLFQVGFFRCWWSVLYIHMCPAGESSVWEGPCGGAVLVWGSLYRMDWIAGGEGIWWLGVCGTWWGGVGWASPRVSHLAA